MDMTIILARVFGIYFLLAAVMVFANRDALMMAVEAMFKERFAQWLAAMIALLGGIAYVNIYQDWSSLPAAILSVIGWAIVIKGLLYAFAPQVKLAKYTRILTERSWYTMDGVLALVVGAYLTGFGFGLW
jgi:hypothetical protein